MRTVDELTAAPEPAWPLVQQWVRDAKHPVEVLAADEHQRRDTLYRLQVTTRSPMGAVVFETGGILVDDGWLRVLGSGHARLTRSIPSWNADKTLAGEGTPPLLLLIADDVVGGFFAINGGGLPGPAGKVQYFAPDSLTWHDLGLAYSELITLAFSGDLERFYDGSRWRGWRPEVHELAGDMAMSIYPFLWTKGPHIT